MRETLDRNFPDQSHSPTCTCQSFSKSSRNTLVKWIHFLRHERVIAREQQLAPGRKHRSSHGPHEELSCNGAEQRWRIREDLQLRADAFASPKSRTLTFPARIIFTFAGFKSRCTTPFSCAASRALQMLFAI